MNSRSVTGKLTSSAESNGDSPSEKTTSAKLSESRPHSVSFNSSVNGASRRPCSSATRLKVDIISSLIDIAALPPLLWASMHSAASRLAQHSAARTHELFDGTLDDEE